MNKTLFLVGLLLFLTACSSSKPTQKVETPYLKVGTGSKIEILGLNDTFNASQIPKGWVIEGLSHDQVLKALTALPLAQMTIRDRERGLFVQTGQKDFIMARYTAAHLSVTPYLMWRWHVSEHRSVDHPVRIIVGFYGGAKTSSIPRNDQFIWTGQGLPKYDRLITIGYGDSGLRRGNMIQVGRIPHYVQKGGIENTNRWMDETTDLENIYKKSWPNDRFENVHITFVGFMSPSKIDTAGMTFSYMWLVR